MNRHRKNGRTWYKETAEEMTRVATPEEARIAMIAAYTGPLAGILPADYRPLLEQRTRGMSANEAGAFASAVRAARVLRRRAAVQFAA